MPNIPDHAIERAAHREFNAGYSRANANILSGIFPPEYTVLDIFGNSDTDILAAKNWIASKNLTRDDVKIIKDHESVKIITRREIYIDMGA